MFTKVTSYFYRFKKTRLAAFTLLECLVALFCLSGSILVYSGLTRSLSANVAYLSNNEQSNWLLFSQQLRSELESSRFNRIENDKLYVTKADKTIAFGKSKNDDFRKTNATGQGYQPMLFGIKSSAISKKGNIVRIDLEFEGGLERSFVYAFEEAG